MRNMNHTEAKNLSVSVSVYHEQMKKFFCIPFCILYSFLYSKRCEKTNDYYDKNKS